MSNLTSSHGQKKSKDYKKQTTKKGEVGRLIEPTTYKRRDMQTKPEGSLTMIP